MQWTEDKAAGHFICTGLHRRLPRFSWDASQELNDPNEGESDDEITLVKERFRSDTNTDCDKDQSIDKDNPTADRSTENRSTTGKRSTHDVSLNEMRRENNELQKSLKYFFSQTKLLKNENESLLKLVENKTLENKTLRSKLREMSSEKEKIDSALTRTKGELSKANAQLFIYEQDITKLKKLNEAVTKEK